MANPLFELQGQGQSVWCDNIARGIIKNGEFQKLIEDFAVVGVTSNPTIFEKAIGHTPDYDDQIRELVQQGKNTDEVYTALVLQDIGDAADIFRPIYDRTNGLDGYISIEVSPDLAHNTELTLRDARHFFQTLNRPNIMIKVPATPEGIPVIEQLISEGINVNVTLIFALEAYETVANAYISGLEKLAASGTKPISQVSSVASFFVSRVDTLVDKLIDDKIAQTEDEGVKAELQSLEGKIAVANSKLAYERFEQLFNSERFQKLREQGAKVQRVLWASTSTKNPKYRDILYAEELIGPDTVDTMPPQTITAFADHGVVNRTLNGDYGEAHADVQKMEAHGIKMSDVTDELLFNGVKSFADSFKQLTDGVEQKRRKIAAEMGHNPEIERGGEVQGAAAGPTLSTETTNAETHQPEAMHASPNPEVNTSTPNAEAAGLKTNGSGHADAPTAAQLDETNNNSPEAQATAFSPEGVQDYSSPSPEQEIAGASTGAGLGKTEAVVQAALEKLNSDNAVSRIWQADTSFWKSDPAVQATIGNRLGWLKVANALLAQVSELTALAQEVKEAGYKSVVLLGMGGSSLAPEVLRRTFGRVEGFPELTVVDTTDPGYILKVANAVDPATTIFIVSSKSGTTTEPNSFMYYFFDKVKAVKGEAAGENFVAITDPATSLFNHAKENNFRDIFVNPPDIGGRYSALSYFGMVPAALAGYDVRLLLSRAVQMAETCQDSSSDNPGLVLGAAMGSYALSGRDKVTFVVPAAISSYGLWAEQLLAESTGKEGRGLVPIAGEYLGSPDNYSNDRFFVALQVQSNPDHAGETVLQALEAAGHPVQRLTLNDLFDVASQFFLWEFAVAVAGQVLDINPFDEPNVQESKDNTKRLLSEFQSNGQLPQPHAVVQENGLNLFGEVSSAAADASPAGSMQEYLSSFLQQVKPGEDYVAFMAYIEPSEAHDAALQNVRQQVRDALKVATTVGYGPRFLHSTGQLHKGGANNGVFVQITTADPQDAPIPGELFSFSILKQAQALGDFQSLQSHGRRAISIHLDNLETGLYALNQVFSQALGAKVSQ